MNMPERNLDDDRAMTAEEQKEHDLVIELRIRSIMQSGGDILNSCIVDNDKALELAASICLYMSRMNDPDVSNFSLNDQLMGAAVRMSDAVEDMVRDYVEGEMT